MNSMDISETTASTENTNEGFETMTERTTTATETAQKSATGTRSSTVITTSTTSTSTSTIYTIRPKNPKKLSAVQENQIKADWISDYVNPEPQHTIDKVKINYYGTYNGNVVLFIYDNYYDYTQAEVDDDFDGIMLHYSDGNALRLWNNGSFIYLSFAYKQGLLTRDDIKDIHYYFQTGK